MARSTIEKTLESTDETGGMLVTNGVSDFLDAHVAL
jgi:hypothetical protein